MCISIFMFFFNFFYCFLQCKEREKKPYCCKDYNLDWDLNVFISAWCIYEPLQTLSVFSPQRVHRYTSGGAIFHGAPPLIAVAASSTDSSGLCLSKVGAAWLLLSSCPATEGGMHCTQSVLVDNYSFSLFFFFFFIPMRWRLPATGEQCCFCDGLSRLRKSEPSFPLSGSMCTCAGIHVFVCVCLCACGFV